MLKEVFHLMTYRKRFYALQSKTKFNFEENLKNIENVAMHCGDGAIIVTPEVAVSGFCYQRMQEADQFASIATERFIKMSENKTIVTTMIESHNGKYFNNLKVFSRGEVIHNQFKSKLFDDENLYFDSGDESDICLFNVDGVKCGALNCFELRFTHLWNLLRGASIIFVTAQWGRARKEHWEILTRALAVANQAFVICADGANDSIAKGSAIISPSGSVVKDDKREVVYGEVDLSEVNKIREYINIGLV